MGVFTQEFYTPAAVPPARLFKAMASDFHNLFPKIVDSIQSVVFIEGTGAPGTIKKMTTVDGEMLHRVDAIDEASFVYNFSIIEGTGLPEKLEKVSFESQVVEGPNGGCIRKAHAKLYTKGDATLSEDDLKANQAKVEGIVKLVESYLLANPHY
ncbi:pathogenesis-related protein 10 [Cajanus cajan]|uniref:Bet v I/Major latex protein domain-containing protein n=1 Tax=Cajanus cajan TaxID=3821 RepID=A0A151RXK1_CAJCA|nr:pathogenesis-related protein 10 [Cajanus cajan]KYP47271.1 hypothetical protein KK1_031062 [Cajanus cajan]